MKRRSLTWLFLSLSAALLAALLLLHAPGAGAVQDPVEMPGTAKEPGRAGNLTVILVAGDSRLPQAVPIPSSWRDIEPERCEPTEEDWAFVRDAATDLSEEEKTRFVTEIRKIFAGESALPREEQDVLKRRLGYYLVEATGGAGTAP
ncbi:hypothetical protein [Methanoculleus oceani]|uniref:Uncharacterized protein n=1 Tax=Methanoculleus oceani TaxID=2184756 RepID=A0ABD4TA17_9EURY|nr:hypothetical protein [Methanoculleus sp. CWC-02]MCM2465183.1 hypothetical protein [Methanoculleus sp. CWC-02]